MNYAYGMFLSMGIAIGISFTLVLMTLDESYQEESFDQAKNTLEQYDDKAEIREKLYQIGKLALDHEDRIQEVHGNCTFGITYSESLGFELDISDSRSGVHCTQGMKDVIYEQYKNWGFSSNE